MTVVRTTKQVLSNQAAALKRDGITAISGPTWLQTPVVGFWRVPVEGGVEHDPHIHEHNQLYLISRGKGKILNAGTEYYVQKGDVVCIKAGDEHDVLEVYGDEPFEKFFLYEPQPVVTPARFGHLHPPGEVAKPHPIPRKPVPVDFPTEPE